MDFSRWLSSAIFTKSRDVKMKWTSRKFWTVITCQVGVFAMLWFDKIAGGEFVTLTTLLVGGYLTANVVGANNANKS